MSDPIILRTMQRLKYLAAVAALVTLFASCEKLSSPTITQGVYGVILERYGDFMPGFEGDQRDHGERYVKRDIYVYEYTLPQDVKTVEPYDINKVTPEMMPTRLVAKTRSTKNGFYQIQLPAGKYSIFILEQGRLYYTDGYLGFYGDGGMNPLTIRSGEVTELDMMIHNECY